MLKLLNSVLLVVILCERIQSIKGEALKCEFQDVGFPWGSMYTCHVSSLDNSRNNMVINSYTGTHLANRNNNDVKAIRIHSSNTKYIPEGLGSLFSLTAFLVEISELIEIKAENFQGMQNLEYLSLGANKITSIPSDAFSFLPKLKVIYLGPNQIKYIGSGAFDQLADLNRVYLVSNICVDKDYNGATEITQMKRDLKVNCVEPISTSTTTTTTQNPMEVELEALKNELAASSEKLQKEKSENLKVKNERDALTTEKGVWIRDRDALMNELSNKTSEIIELKTNCNQPIETIGAVDVKLNEIMNHLMKESKDHQMECNEIIKLRAELSTSKDELKMAKDQQMTDLSDAKETMKQTINDLNTELMEVKSQRQLERITYRELRSKLMEVNEKLATCEINERSLV